MRKNVKYQKISKNKFFAMALIISMCFTLAFSACSNEGKSPEILYPSPKPEVTEEPKVEESEPETSDSSEESEIPDENEVMVIEPSEGATFATVVENILFNPEAFVGRKVEIEGIFKSFEDKSGQIWGAVYREEDEDDGHGHEGEIEFSWDKEMPKEGAWIKVNGTFEYVFHDGMQYLSIRADNVEVIDENYQAEHAE